ncbi:HAD family hydrolase [Flavobacterium oreochromis]|uniref:HAD family hydrolase n=1 Tax=Flavobacterium oreochromis TaxID=2906078 RepID=UPI001CE6F92F|nr:HAD family hydrolase [Flavobacterium oreochromis]QYS87470.1 HAD family hydrolase [Flavobacterium oreochromis]
MTISFDLDDTLIPTTFRFDVEKQNFLQRVFKIEKIRKGSIKLFKELEKRHIKVNIYTTSYRSKSRIKIMFMSYGIKVHKIINQQEHNKYVKIQSSKFPPIFNIDIHIDDSTGVKLEGEKYNFKTIIIDKENNNWVCEIFKSISN